MRTSSWRISSSDTARSLRTVPSTTSATHPRMNPSSSRYRTWTLSTTVILVNQLDSLSEIKPASQFRWTTSYSVETLFFRGLLFGQKNEIRNVGLFMNVQIGSKSTNGVRLLWTRDGSNTLAHRGGRDSSWSPDSDCFTWFSCHGSCGAERQFVSNDLVGDLTDGKGNIVMGSPLVEPGDYSADLSIQRK